MKKQCFVSVILLSLLLGNELWAETPEGRTVKSFVCEEQATVSANKTYLTKLNSEINKLVDQLRKVTSNNNTTLSPQNVNIGIVLLKKVLCFHQIEGSLVIFEDLHSILDSALLRSSQMKLTVDEKTRLSEALIDLGRPEEP
jgi:hypothetical protein